ncbi:hypothetical protein [Streptomyces sp. NPDC046862]|uniref:hypothetical protein n=1 Tax=Streptomyces sp. NPDC046862 TaxID=3154603 RepID=UPI0034557FF3
MTDQSLADELSEWLLGHGFSIMEEVRETGGFENVWIRFAGEGCEVQLLRERGKWGITLSPPSGDPRLAPQIWRYYIDNSALEETLAERGEPFETEVSFVRNRLHEVIAAAQSDENIGDRLTEINWTIIKDSLGLDPNMPQPGQPGFEDFR